MDRVTYHTDRNSESPLDVVQLLEAVGWGEVSIETRDPYAERIRKSWQFYDTIIFARQRGELVGYASACSDGAFTTGMGELVVHPSYRRRGIGRELLRLVQEKCAGVPFYIKTFKGNEAFFESCGFKVQPQMVVLSKR